MQSELVSSGKREGGKNNTRVSGKGAVGKKPTESGGLLYVRVVYSGPSSRGLPGDTVYAV